MIRTKKQYAAALRKELGGDLDMKRYEENMDVNFIILMGGDVTMPMSWRNGMPVVFGAKGDAIAECHQTDRIITEKEYYSSLR